MDTDSIVFSFNPLKGLIYDQNQLSKNSDLVDVDQSVKLISEDNKKVKGKFKLESTPDMQKEETQFLRSNSYIIKKPINITETKQNWVKSLDKYTLKECKKTQWRRKCFWCYYLFGK